MNIKKQRQDKRKKKIRSRITGVSDKPRLTVFRSNKFIYAQLIDDSKGKTLAAASSKGSVEKETKTQKAMRVGENIAKTAKAKKIKKCVFDRRGYKYHGIIKAVAEGARKGGLEF